MVGLSAHGESADLPLDNMLAVTFRQQAGQYVVLRLRGRNDAMLQLWHDGLQAVLAAYLASRRFTTEAHADWLRPAHTLTPTLTLALALPLALTKVRHGGRGGPRGGRRSQPQAGARALRRGKREPLG